jgi:putative addiction module component (TIGR02574 family)
MSSTPTTDLWERALSLPIEERVRLAADLMRSVDTVPQAEIDAAWADEAERRLDRYLAGQTTAAPADEVIARTQEWLRSRRK